MAKLPREVPAEVSALASDGLGIAEVEGRALRIRNALPGETVQARIISRRKGSLFADGVGVVSASNDRREPACCYFPRCGGCSMHHMVYSAQLALKQKQVHDALAAHEIAALCWSAPQSSARLGYRRKARLGVRRLGDQVLVGFRESFSSRVAKLDECVILTPELSSLLRPLKKLLPHLSIAHRIPQLELAQGDDGCVIIVRHLDPLTDQDFALWSAFERVHRVRILLQGGGYDSLASLDGSPMIPLGYCLEEWGVHMRFLPHQFTQVNPAMNKAIIRHALSYLGDLRGRSVVDLFCGIGNFTLPMARAGAHVRGVEVAGDAVEMARHNAALNGLSGRASFGTADLYAENPGHGELLVGADVLLLDPPRSGAGPNLPAWISGFTGEEIVYVSCNPTTFAADAGVLTAAGFTLCRVGVFDMFPHTAHVETLGYFRRGGEQDPW